MMNRRILVAYASKLGSTAEIAQVIGHMLEKNGADADIHMVTNVHGLDDYEAVVLGSAIRDGRPLPEVLRFVETHREALQRMPVALFIVCLTMRNDTEANRQVVDRYIEPLMNQLQPVDVALFAGRLDPKSIAPLTRLKLKLMRLPPGDFRKWYVISDWAATLAPLLLEPSPVPG